MKQGNTYACSDIHGNYDIWKQIKDYMKPEDKMFFIGDAIDRGKDGVFIMNDIIKDDRITYIKGNHEDMFAKCVPHFIEGHFDNQSNWYDNGGKPTWDKIKKTSEESMMWFVQKINRMTTMAEYTNRNRQEIIMCHAGMTPGEPMPTRQDDPDYEPHIWDRSHITDVMDTVKYANTYVIHGHTPMAKTAVVYCDGHKICIDIDTPKTGVTCLFNVETMRVEQYFTSNPVKYFDPIYTV